MTSATFNGNERATHINRDGDKTVCRYHDTDVVTYDHATRTVTLNSGGFQTYTTKHRMNQAARSWNLGFTVYQRDFEWYVSRWGEDLAFHDGIQINV